jgi:hypothetical protein
MTVSVLVGMIGSGSPWKGPSNPYDGGAPCPRSQARGGMAG